MSTPSAELEDRLDAAHASDFSTSVFQLHTHTSRGCVQQKTEMEKLNAFGRERVLQLRPGCQVPPVSPE